MVEMETRVPKVVLCNCGKRKKLSYHILWVRVMLFLTLINIHVDANMYLFIYCANTVCHPFSYVWSEAG